MPWCFGFVRSKAEGGKLKKLFRKEMRLALGIRRRPFFVLLCGENSSETPPPASQNPPNRPSSSSSSFFYSYHASLAILKPGV